MLTPCKCCFGTLRHAIRFLDEDAELRARVAQALAADGLAWSGKTEVVHLLPVLAREVGVDTLAAAVRAPRTGLRVAAQYGCHALRPSNVTRFDNPLAPTIFETLIRATGATPVDWPRRLDCCGDPLHEANAPLSARMTRAKIADALESGAEVLCTACPHCHLRFESVQASAPAPAIRTLLYTAAPRPRAGPAGGVPRAVAPGAARHRQHCPLGARPTLWSRPWPRGNPGQGSSCAMAVARARCPDTARHEGATIGRALSVPRKRAGVRGSGCKPGENPKGCCRSD